MVNPDAETQDLWREAVSAVVKNSAGLAALGKRLFLSRFSACSSVKWGSFSRMVVNSDSPGCAEDERRDYL